MDLQYPVHPWQARNWGKVVQQPPRIGVAAPGSEIASSELEQRLPQSVGLEIRWIVRVCVIKPLAIRVNAFHWKLNLDDVSPPVPSDCRGSMWLQQVIGVQKNHNFILRRRPCLVERANLSSVARQKDNPGTVAIAFDHFLRSVGRAIIDNDHLAFKIVLRQGAFDGERNELRVIVVANDNAYSR